MTKLPLVLILSSYIYFKLNANDDININFKDLKFQNL